MKFNGIMIDCARLVERHEYYFKLIDFMAEWGMDTLLFHFTDDHGCSVRLPGFENIASKHALSADETELLVKYARRRKIAVIPELETFGHIRYLTDNPRYAHLHLQKDTNRSQLSFNAIDPLNPESIELMDRLISATCKLFQSEYIHIGCDEVDLGNLSPEDKHGQNLIWTEYVNKIIALARARRKTPMMWADHPTNDPDIAEQLRKDVILFDWRYGREVSEQVAIKLKEAGFKQIVASPSIACYGYRFKPGRTALLNSSRMASLAMRHGYIGVINTIWCPYRYFQETLYYGIAFSARCTRKRTGRPQTKDFNSAFISNVFGDKATPKQLRFLSVWARMDFDYHIAKKLIDGQKPTASENTRIKEINALAAKSISLSDRLPPVPRNKSILQSMILSAKAAWLCSEYMMLKRRQAVCKTRIKHYNETLRKTRKEASECWDRTRFPDDPHKYKGHFLGQDENYAMILLSKIRCL